VNGKAVADDVLEMTGEPITNLVITFTDRTTELTGTVLDARGQPDRNADVVVFPAGIASARDARLNARTLRSVRTSQAGIYSIVGLIPGDYLIAAVLEPPGDFQDLTFLQSLVRYATRVTVADGEKRTQPLTSRIVR
jgi:hypothetical protein